MSNIHAYVGGLGRERLEETDQGRKNANKGTELEKVKTNTEINDKNKNKNHSRYTILVYFCVKV